MRRLVLRRPINVDSGALRCAPAATSSANLCLDLHRPCMLCNYTKSLDVTDLLSLVYNLSPLAVIPRCRAFVSLSCILISELVRYSALYFLLSLTELHCGMTL